MKYLFFISFSVLKVAAHAQRQPTGVWFSANVPVQLSNKWQWHNDAGYRTLGNSVYASQYLYRTGLRYKVNKIVSTAAGVAFFFTRTSFSKQNHEFGSEFRLWQEALLQKQLSKPVQLQVRIRTEQRFFKETERREAFTAHRFRLRVAAITKIKERYSIQLADEYFHQQAHKEFLFDQNRLMLSNIFKVNKSTQLLAGYMWLLWPQSSSQHILTLTFQKSIFTNGISANK